MYVYTYIRIHIHRHLCINIHTYIRIHIHRHLCINIHTYIRIHIHRHLCMKIHTYVPERLTYMLQCVAVRCSSGAAYIHMFRSRSETYVCMFILNVYVCVSYTNVYVYVCLCMWGLRGTHLHTHPYRHVGSLKL